MIKLEIKDLIDKVVVNDKKFDYFISQIRSESVMCRTKGNNPCYGCLENSCCNTCLREKSILTRGNIVFIVDKNTNYYEYEFILKLLSCMGLDYSRIGYIATTRNEDGIDDESCIINNINSEDNIHKPIKYICMSDNAYYKLKELEYEIINNTIRINDRVIPFIKILDIHTLANDYENSKGVFVNQLIKAMEG